jgi:hypothetical protein
MPLFGNNIPRAEAARLRRDLATVRAERDGFKAERDALDHTLTEARADLAEARAAQPANLGDITHFLRAFVPTLPMAPGYSSLTAATDAKSYAQAIHLLLLHSRSVGHREATK